MSSIQMFWRKTPVTIDFDHEYTGEDIEITLNQVTAGGVNILPIFENHDDLIEELLAICHAVTEDEFEQNDADARMDAIMEWRGYEH